MRGAQNARNSTRRGKFGISSSRSETFNAMFAVSAPRFLLISRAGARNAARESDRARNSLLLNIVNSILPPTSRSSHARINRAPAPFSAPSEIIALHDTFACNCTNDKVPREILCGGRQLPCLIADRSFTVRSRTASTSTFVSHSRQTAFRMLKRSHHSHRISGGETRAAPICHCVRREERWSTGNLVIRG